MCVWLCVSFGPLDEHLSVDIKNKVTLQPAPLFTAQQSTQTTAMLDFSSVCSFFLSFMTELCCLM